MIHCRLLLNLGSWIRRGLRGVIIYCGKTPEDSMCLAALCPLRSIRRSMDARWDGRLRRSHGILFCGISNMIPPISREYRQNSPSPRWGRLHTKEFAATSRRCCRTRRRRSRRATIDCWRIGSSRVRQIPIPDCTFVVPSRDGLLMRTWTKTLALWRQNGSNHARILAIRPRRSSSYLRKDSQAAGGCCRWIRWRASSFGSQSQKNFSSWLK